MNPVEWLLYAAAWQVFSGPTGLYTKTEIEAAALVVAYGGAIRQAR